MPGKDSDSLEHHTNWTHFGTSRGISGASTQDLGWMHKRKNDDAGTDPESPTGMLWSVSTGSSLPSHQGPRSLCAPYRAYPCPAVLSHPSSKLCSLQPEEHLLHTQRCPRTQLLRPSKSVRTPDLHTLRRYPWATGKRHTDKIRKNIMSKSSSKQLLGF